MLLQRANQTSHQEPIVAPPAALSLAAESQPIAAPPLAQQGVDPAAAILSALMQVPQANTVPPLLTAQAGNLTSQQATVQQLQQQQQQHSVPLLQQQADLAAALSRGYAIDPVGQQQPQQPVLGIGRNPPRLNVGELFQQLQSQPAASTVDHTTSNVAEPTQQQPTTQQLLSILLTNNPSSFSGSIPSNTASLPAATNPLAGLYMQPPGNEAITSSSNTALAQFLSAAAGMTSTPVAPNQAVTEDDSGAASKPPGDDAQNNSDATDPAGPELPLSVLPAHLASTATQPGASVRARKRRYYLHVSRTLGTCQIDLAELIVSVPSFLFGDHHLIFNPSFVFAQESFPSKLYRLLIEAEVQGMREVVSFTGNGTSFNIHNRESFTKVILPRYFRHDRLSSFKRMLRLYGFKRRESGGPDDGSFYHPMFVRGRPELCLQMKRITEYEVVVDGPQSEGNGDPEGGDEDGDGGDKDGGEKRPAKKSRAES